MLHLTPLSEIHKRSEELDRPRSNVRSNLSLIFLLSDRRGMVWSRLHLHAFRLQRELVRKCNFDIFLYIYIKTCKREKKKKNLVHYFVIPNAPILYLSLSPKRFHRTDKWPNTFPVATILRACIAFFTRQRLRIMFDDWMISCSICARMIIMFEHAAIFTNSSS